MRRFVFDFLRRGVTACGLGPIVLAIVYLILQQVDNVRTLSVNEVCIGIFSLLALAFVAGGMNAIYQIERLQLMIAILIHGGVLYLSYLVTYLLNDWLDFGVISLVVFSTIFVVGFIVIWAVIYLVIRNKTAKINEILKQKRQNP